MRRIEEIAGLFEDKLGKEKRDVFTVAAGLRDKLNQPKYEEFLTRAESIISPGESYTDRAGKSAKDRVNLTTEWEDDLQKEARRKKSKMTRKQILKELSKARDVYKTLRNDLYVLEAEKKTLDEKIQSAKAGLTSSRKDMLKMNQVVTTMDLVDSNYAVFYENDDEDIAYLIDKEEYHIELNDVGEANTTLMKDHMKSRRDEKKSDENEADLQDLIPGIDRLEDSAPRTEQNTITSYPNLRFAE